MSTLQIIFADNTKKGSPAWKAWRQVLPLFLNGTLQEDDCLHASLSGEVSNDQRRVGVAITLGTNDFWENFIQLERAGCEFFINVTDSGGNPKPWLDLEPRWRGICMQRCFAAPLKNVSLAAKIKAVVKDSLPKIKPHLRLCHPVADAKELVGVLPEFTHGGALDVTNIMLAPARMLCRAEVDAKQKIAAWTSWADKSRKWRTEGCSKLEKCRVAFEAKTPPQKGERKIGSDNLLAAELFESWECINSWLSADAPTIEDKESEVLELERMMGLLTEIRLIGKGKPENSDSQSPAEKVLSSIKRGEPTAEKVFRVLVVDDHAQCWYDAIGLAANLASQELKGRVEVDFSTDAKTVISQGAADFWPSLLGYDLVLLDVYLPGGTKGTELLAKLRESVNWLPVIIWTSSLSSELAGSAALHNGYIFKKTSSVEQLCQTFVVWLPIGCARRHHSLPNRFFNYTIQDLRYRRLAVDFHEWCLKQLDSFHALDNEYFRYFTDHGGRHIVKLWELLERALQPFLQDEGGALLPNDPKQRELEILGLYLTVICHELGMFPMRIGNKVEDFSTLGTGYLNDVRSLHAVRGMALLRDNTRSLDDDHIGQYWNDKRGSELGGMLRKPGMEGLADRLAVLVGYHARVFESLAEDAFLCWEYESDDGKVKLGAKYSLAKKLEQLSSPVPSLSRADNTFQDAYVALSERFTDPTAKNRLRRQCALFRFVDALDITASRNPAEFLVGSGTLPAKQYAENLKRELCQTAEIRNGEVRVQMMPPAPALDLLKKVIAITKGLVKEKELLAAVRAESFLLSEVAAGRVAKPWDLQLESKANDGERLDILQTKSVLILHKPLDSWLANVWEVLMEDGGKEAFVNELKELGILDGRTHEASLIREGAQMIASITALSVAGELLDEYRAIVEAGLSNKIRLAPFKWDGVTDWSKIPSELVTLSKLLTEEARP